MEIKAFIKWSISSWENSMALSQEMLSKTTTEEYKTFHKARISLMENFIVDLNIILTKLLEGS